MDISTKLSTSRRQGSLLLAFAGTMLVAGGVLAVHGLLQLDPAHALKWTAGGAARAAALAGGLAFVLYVTTYRPGARIVSRAAGCAVVLLAAAGAAAPLLGVVAIALACTLVGERLRALWRDAADQGHGTLYSLLLGAGAYGTLTAFLAHWPVNTPGVYALLVAAPIIVDHRRAGVLLRGWSVDASASPTPGIRVPAIAACSLAVLYGVVALFPELGWDALALHLHVAAETIGRHAWHYDVTRHSFAVSPLLADWLLTIAFALGGETGARLLVVGAVVVLAALTASIVRNAGGRSAWAWGASALLLSTPVIYTIGSSLFIDSIWAAFVVAGVAILVPSDTRTASPGEVITAAVLLGFSAAAKAVSLPLVPIFVVLALARLRSLPPRAVLRIMLFAAVAAAIAGSTPYATAWLLTGNPVFPFFNRLFASPLFPVEGVTFGERFQLGLHWDDLYRITFRGAEYIEGRAGSAGFQWLILLPAALVALLSRKHRRHLWLPATGVAMVALTFQFQTYLRYVVPALAVLTATIALGASKAAEASPVAGRVAAGVAALCFALNLAFMNAAAAYEQFPLAAAFGNAAERHAVVAASSPHRLAARLASELSQRTGRIALLSPPAFSDSTVDAVHASWYSPAFFRAFGAADSTAQLAHVLGAWDIRYLVVHPYWVAGTAATRVNDVSAPVARVGDVQVRKVRSDLALTRELLRNPDFASTEGWVMTPNVRYDAAGRVVIVSASSPAYQAVGVKAGDLYLYAVHARCDAPTDGRLQVIWIAADGSSIGRPDVRTFDCTARPSTHEQELVAPPQARTAIVYATGHTAAEVAIARVSFRAKPALSAN